MENDFRSQIQKLSSHEILTLCDRLVSDRRTRDREHVFFVEGIRGLLSAVDNRWSIEAVLYSDRLLTSGIARSKVRSLRRRGLPTFKLSPEEFRHISRLRASGVAIIVRQRIQQLSKVADAAPCLLAVDSIQSAGNLGTLLRTSAAIGASGLITIGMSLDVFCPMFVRSTMGAIFTQPIFRANYGELKLWARRTGTQVIGASPDAEVSYFRFAFNKPCVIALGNERKGLSPEMTSVCTGLVRIPMVGGIDSLNVGVAGSLLLYEVARSCDRDLI